MKKTFQNLRCPGKKIGCWRKSNAAVPESGVHFVFRAETEPSPPSSPRTWKLQQKNPYTSGCDKGSWSCGKLVLHVEGAGGREREGYSQYPVVGFGIGIASASAWERVARRWALCPSPSAWRRRTAWTSWPRCPRSATLSARCRWSCPIRYGLVASHASWSRSFLVQQHSSSVPRRQTQRRPVRSVLLPTALSFPPVLLLFASFQSRF